MKAADRSLDKLALIDLDGTLIDARYHITDVGIYDAIADTQSAGWRVGLSSDTPYEALDVWRKRFGMNGPLVAERGAVVEIGGQPDIDPETLRAFAAAREAAADKFERLGLRLWSGNPVEALRTNMQLGEVDELVVLMNGLSQASLRYFVRRVNSRGELQIDQAATEGLAAQVRELYPAFSDVEEEINPAYGLVVASRKRYTKRLGTRRLMAAMELQRVAMIGDSMSDYVGSDLAWHGAVGDADPEFQARADYVALDSNTAGVVEILRALRTTRAFE